jgi:hypothetical protein
MKKALLVLITILSASPAFADDDAAAREKDRQFYSFSAPPTTNEEEPITTDKGCLEYRMPLWFRNKYGNNQGMNVLQDIYNGIVSKDIIEKQTCNCAMLYQKWDQAIAIYEKDYAKLNPWAAYGTESERTLTRLNIKSQTAITKARKICQMAGAW